MERVAVVGSSGSGKSTLAGALAPLLDARHIELDSLYHLPGWQPRPQDELRRLVDEATASSRWVVDGNYAMVRDIVWSKADTLVWLDYGRTRTTGRVAARTLRRGLRHEELWNGNREDWRSMFSPDAEKNIVLWSYTNHHRYRDDYESAIADPRWAHLTVRRFTHPRETTALLASVQG